MKSLCLLGCILLVTALAGACASKDGSIDVTNQTPESADGTVSAPWEPDGVVSAGEYAHQTSVGDVKVWWSNDAEFLYLAMEAQSLGWVAVGLDPEKAMQGANFLFGAVENGEPKVWDAYGTASGGPTHPLDEELGGTNDIVRFGGVEEDGVTRFEVQIPLNSGDEFDKVLEPGKTYPIIAAVGRSDSFAMRHASRAAGEITLD
ncbi:MAG: hypothetical protein A2Y73_05805 [Chloroflexi bacterium RBG_13_56_8]|nr:MAG: hypothetical protein A2Y73_05805 [Chloroflexi bacterium RBG_13_56_8]